MVEQWDGQAWDGAVFRTSWAAVAEEPLEVPMRPVGQVLADSLHDVGRGLGRASVTAGAAPRCGEAELLTGLEALDGLAARVQQLLVAVTVEAHRRGTHLDTGLSVHDWLSVRCPGLSRRQVGDLSTTVKAWDAPGHGAIREAVTNRSMSVARAATLLRALSRVEPVTDAVVYEQVVNLLMPVACQGSDRDLRKATDHLIAVALSDKEKEARVEACRESRGVHESSLADGSLTRFIITADAEGAAAIRAILNSPLAAPSPCAEGDDTRTATQRRYDALLAVIARGVSSPGAAPSTSKAKIFVTIPLSALLVSLAAPLTRPAGGCTTAGCTTADAPLGSGTAFTPPSVESGWSPTGVGRTFTGETLTPGQVRRMACQADLIPTVLGTDSEVLDLGREARLASPAQHKKLWLRDIECTFPGCTVPNTWCDAHHVTWWSRGGPTDIANMALLCGRHHTIVHDKDLSATTDATGVTWHV